jgi:tRNA threonylcarbamoyl adenosine modification protein (Sua5/YciO/YrdC/YwlC family)
MRLQINENHPEPRKIAQAVKAMRQGGVVAYPTDTVYGLGCDIMQKKAIDEVYRMKRMAKDQPLAFVCRDLSNIAQWAQVDDRAYRIMKRLTPGPYCFILPASREVPKVLMMKRKQVGIRVPDHPVPQALIAELGNPIVSTSASWEGETLWDPAEIDARFKGLAMVLEVDQTGDQPSTVIDLTGDEPTLIREGAGPADFLVG